MKNKELKYKVIIYWSKEDDAFIAEIPELPGCSTHGDTYEEVIENAVEAMEGWIEAANIIGKEVPPPTETEERMSREEFYNIVQSLGDKVYKLDQKQKHHGMLIARWEGFLLSYSGDDPYEERVPMIEKWIEDQTKTEEDKD